MFRFAMTYTGLSWGPFHGKWTNFRKHSHFTISDFDEILQVASTTFQTRFCKVSASDNQLVYTHHQCRGDICCCKVAPYKKKSLKLFSGPTRQATIIKFEVPTKLGVLNTVIILPLLKICPDLYYACPCNVAQKFPHYNFYGIVMCA